MAFNNRIPVPVALSSGVPTAIPAGAKYITFTPPTGGSITFTNSQGKSASFTLPFTLPPLEADTWDTITLTSVGGDSVAVYAF